MSEKKRERGEREMVEEFMVCVDRIIASSSSSSTSTIAPEACSETSLNNYDGEREKLLSITAKNDDNGAFSFKNKENSHGVVLIMKCQESEQGSTGEGKLNGKSWNLKECRICQEEDAEQDMEAPCACNGTLKFAHRKCIQRWCNRKGDITCEICNQIFSPDYTLPPKQSNPEVMAIDIRQAWASNIDLRDPRFLAFAAAQHQLLHSEYDDYAIASSGTFAYFRMVVIALMLLLLIRQTLMVTRDLGMLQESSTFFRFQIIFLQLAGFLLPCYVMARSVYLMQCRRRRQV